MSTGFGPPAHPVSFRKVTGPATGTPCAGAAGRVPDIDHRMCFRLAPALLTLHHDIAVRPQRSEYGQWVVTLGLQGVDISAVAELTTSHVDETIAVVSDDVVLVAPTVQGPIRGAIQISGPLTQRTAYRIAHLLRP
ncbi:MAG: SecDF P1 head subdomain-containing protein [Mycobacteriales bacterium]